MVFSIAEVAEEAADGSQAGHCRGLGADALPVAQDLRQRILALPVTHQGQHTPQDIVRQQAQQRAAALPANRAERPRADCVNMAVKRSGWSWNLLEQHPFGSGRRAMGALVLCWHAPPWQA